MSEKTIRREDARLLKGSGRYTADWNLPGQVYAFFLRSDRAHAEIVSIDAGVATARKDVHAVLSGADYAASGWKSLPGGVSYEGVGGQKQKKPFWPALAQKKVHYVGQPLALVVAESAALAQDAAEEIAVEHRDLPAAIGFEGATRPGAPQLHEDISGNLAFEYETGDPAAVQAAFAGAALKTRLTVRSQRLVGNPIEPRAFLASFDAGSGVFTVYSPSQGLNGMRGFLAAATGLPGEKIRVITELVGGSFGIRSFSYSYRGAGRPDIACVIERLVDRAAAEHGFDPIALRRKNFIPPEAMPYKTANGTTYDCGEFEKVMDKALELADWSGFPVRREHSKREGKLRGIGIATFLEASAAGVAPKDQAYARFDASGILHVSCVSQSTGQGHETAFVRILCEGLGLIDENAGERIRIHEGNLDLTVVGNGTGGSRSLYGAGSAVKLLVDKLIETSKPLAAVALGADVEYGGGQFKASSKSIGFFELA